jgi:hypothetical protein
VPSGNEYRELAANGFQSARQAQTDDERMMYFTLAQTWLEEARVETARCQFAYRQRPQL